MSRDKHKHRQLLKLRRRHFKRIAQDANSGAGPASDIALDSEKANHAHHHIGAHAPVEAEKQVEKLKDQLLRQQAEFENTRRRMQRDAQQQGEFANQKLIEGLLPVLDNFDRAITTPGDSIETLLNGIQMVRNQLSDFLKQHGLEKIESLGQPFDPNKHEAVSAAPPEDGQAENQVVEVFQEGYQLKNRLIRPAMVKVAK